MKRYLLLLAFIVSASVSFAQAPEKFSYQAIVRNSLGEIIKNKTIPLRISILKGSNTAQPVYVEVHSAQCNENGLITLEIGAGTNSGEYKFSDIKWGEDSYFLKVEADVDSNDTYTLSGTSQLLSVPYALHAKTAGNLMDEDGNIIPAQPKHYIGEVYGGGIIFWVDSTGEHGLIISPKDLSQEQVWSNILTAEIGKELAGSRVNGNKNSSAIVAQSGHTNSAARLCLDYTNQDTGTGSFSDWYLPGVEEMKKLWENLYEVEKAIALQSDLNSIESISPGLYWTSTEYNGYCAWGFNFYNGNPYSNNKFTLGYVRAVRSF